MRHEGDTSCRYVRSLCKSQSLVLSRSPLTIWNLLDVSEDGGGARRLQVWGRNELMRLDSLIRYLDSTLVLTVSQRLVVTRIAEQCVEVFRKNQGKAGFVG